MSYLGQAALKNSELKRFTVTSSTSATHVLSWTAPNEQSLWITINGVKQQDDAYSIAGIPTTITLTDPLVATDKMEVIGVLDIGEITIVGDNSVDSNKLANNAVTTGKISPGAVESTDLADNAVTLAKMAGLARGKIIVGDASGDPSALTVGTADQVLTSDGTDAAWADAATGITWQTVVTTATTMVAGNGYFVNTTSSAFSMTLPASATLGDEVHIIDYAGTFDSNNCTVARNSHKIQGATSDLVVSTERAAFKLVYVDATQGWLLTEL